MKWTKCAAISLLAATIMVVQSVFPVFAEETSAEQKNPETIVGELCVYTQENGIHKVDAALYDESMILVSPQTAAKLTGTELVDVGNGKFEFWRDRYVVQVDTGSGDIAIGLSIKEDQAIEIYQKENFSLQETQPVRFGQEKISAIPLEQMLYLLNAQWICAENCVYIYNPPETLWNVVGDFWEMCEVLPSPAEILGDTVLKKWGNSFKYGLLAFADEVAPEYLLPIVGNDYWSRQKMEEALLTLAAPSENIMESFQEEAQNDSSEFISDIGGMVGDISTLGGGAVSVVEKLTKSVTAWSNVKIPDSISKAFSVAGFEADMAKAIVTAGRYENWGESYRSQLEYLSKVQNNHYADYCKDLNKVAGSLFKEYGDYTGNVTKEVLETVWSFVSGTFLDMTPAGLVFSSYDLVHTFVEAYVPAAKIAQEAGDNTSAAMRLNDLSVLMRAQYADEILRVVQMGTLDSIKDVAQLRSIGSLMMDASVHSHDSLYSAWKNMYLTKHSGASEEEIRQNAGETISMDALAGKMIQSQTSITRFEETSQYDPSLILYGNMENLYCETAGAHREKIPPEYVQPVSAAENNGGNVVRYLGNLYYWKKAENQLICRHEDGSEEVLLNTQGSGPIFIVGDRIYLQERSNSLFSVDLDGNNRVDHGEFIPMAADDKAGTLIGYENGDLSLLFANDHSVQKLAENAAFWIAEDGYFYYSSIANGEAVLWKAAGDGSEIAELGRLNDSQDWVQNGESICQVVKSGDTLYYSYGHYAGTGLLFQGGGISCINMDGTNNQTCVPYGEMNAEVFQVIETGDETQLYYVGKEDDTGSVSMLWQWENYPYKKCHVATRKTGEETWVTAPSSVAFSKPGSFICVNGEIVRYNEELMSYQTLIPKEAGFDFLDNPQVSDDKIALVTQLDILGEDLFFTVSWMVRIGDRFMMRPQYDRERSVFYTMKIGESEPVELYSY